MKLPKNGRYTSDILVFSFRSTAFFIQEILTCSNYLRSIGLVVDAALFRIMDDVLSLQDIPEADSERLSELCEMLDSLQNLFAYGTGDVCFKPHFRITDID